jgi:hypothetical protein
MAGDVLMIHTGRDGRLVGQSETDVSAVVAELGAARRAVVHFHGGLVNRKAGMATANRLDPWYRAVAAVPAFFVWESGLVETVKNNLGDIARETIFTILRDRLLKHVVGKVNATAGQKAAGQLPYPKDIELATELKRAADHGEPYAHLAAPANLDETTEAERRQLEKELEKDVDFQQEARAIAREALPTVATELDSSKGVLARQRKSAKTLLSPAVVQELEVETSKGAKGVLSTASLILRAGSILVHVVRRLRARRGHGIYPTVVEEILRELYLANVGAEIWYQMKRETADSFVDDGSAKGGRLFIKELRRQLAAGKRPQITLVGHSTGAVFILNLLRYVYAQRQATPAEWPEDFAFEHIVFLAPACDFSHLRETIEQHRGLFHHFRMFAMHEEKESADVLVPGIYTRSLLYFVSGVVERETDGKCAYDLPIVGMERYYEQKDVYDQPEIAVARAFLAESARHAVWSVTDQGDDGLLANAVSHGGFDDTDAVPPAKNLTMLSVQHLIEHGA